MRVLLPFVFACSCFPYRPMPPKSFRRLRLFDRPSRRRGCDHRSRSGPARHHLSGSSAVHAHLPREGSPAADRRLQFALPAQLSAANPHREPDRPLGRHQGRGHDRRCTRLRPAGACCRRGSCGGNDRFARCRCDRRFRGGQCRRRHLCSSPRDTCPPQSMRAATFITAATPVSMAIANGGNVSRSN